MHFKCDPHLCHSQEVCSEGLASPQKCQEAAHRETEGELSRDGHLDYADFQEDPHRVQLDAALQDDIGVAARDEEGDSCAVTLLHIVADDLFLWDAISRTEDSSLKTVAIFTCKATESFQRCNLQRDQLGILPGCLSFLFTLRFFGKGIFQKCGPLIYGQMQVVV